MDRKPEERKPTFAEQLRAQVNEVRTFTGISGKTRTVKLVYGDKPAVEVFAQILRNHCM